MVRGNRSKMRFIGAGTANISRVRETTLSGMVPPSEDMDSAALLKPMDFCVRVIASVAIATVNKHSHRLRINLETLTVRSSFFAAKTHRPERRAETLLADPARAPRGTSRRKTCRKSSGDNRLSCRSLWLLLAGFSGLTVASDCLSVCSSGFIPSFSFKTQQKLLVSACSAGRSQNFNYFQLFRVCHRDSLSMRF